MSSKKLVQLLALSACFLANEDEVLASQSVQELAEYQIQEEEQPQKQGEESIIKQNLEQNICRHNTTKMLTANKQEQNQKNQRKRVSRKMKTILAQDVVPKARNGPNQDQPVPTAIFHGVKQTCHEDLLKNLVEQVHQGTKGHVECIEIGNGDISSIFSTLVSQTEEACSKIRDHKVFGQQEFNVLGLSQGSLIGRYIVESCDTKFPVRNFVTVGGPNNGMDFEDNCHNDIDNTRCELQDKITSFPLLSPYSKVIQSTIGPSNYFKDHRKLDEYLDNSLFLPYLNNEKDHPKANLNKKRFEQLNHFLMVKFLHDPIIFPQESAWFGEIDPKDGHTITMQETKLFKENKFGLKTLYDQGRVEWKDIDGVHLMFRNDHIQDIFVPALKK